MHIENTEKTQLSYSIVLYTKYKYHRLYHVYILLVNDKILFCVETE